MEKLKEDIAKFNKDYLIGKPYQESIYVKKEMNNFIQQNDSIQSIIYHLIIIPPFVLQK